MKKFLILILVLIAVCNCGVNPHGKYVCAKIDECFWDTITFKDELACTTAHERRSRCYAYSTSGDFIYVGGSAGNSVTLVLKKNKLREAGLGGVYDKK